MLLISYIIYRYLESLSPKPQKAWKNKRTKPEVLGMPGKPKTKKTYFEENVWFWLKRGFFLFVFHLFSGLKWNNRKKNTLFVFCFFWMDMINQDIKKTKNQMFFVFETFQCRKPNLTCWKAKKNREYCLCFLTFWLIISIQKPKKQSFFVLSISKPKNKNNKN